MTTLAEEIHERFWRERGERHNHSEDIDGHIRRLIVEVAPLTPSEELEEVLDGVRAYIDGLGPVHVLGLDPTVSEILINGDGRVWVERAGRLSDAGLRLDPEQALHLARRLAAQVGRRIDAVNPAVDVRLADGSRLHAIIPPLAVDGPCVSIRRFPERPIGLHQLADPRAAEILVGAVEARRTIIIAGGTSSGKTSLLNALGDHLPADERVVTIEDAAELRLPGHHVVRLETRPSAEGISPVALRDLTRHALRMRPDRIICGEMRGPEALDLVQAMNTGHPGSLSTVHANSASDALRRIETMMLLGDAELPLAAIRDQLASCVDLVVMMRRAVDGSRFVDSISIVPDQPSVGWELEEVYLR